MPVAATAVLVHGAWHGAWCWEQVVPRLRARGVATMAVDLPGHGEDSGPLEDLHGDARRVRNVLDAIDGPVVLVGHSYGGAVITEAGMHPSVSHLVFLAAFPLDAGETCGSAAGDDPRAARISHEGRPELGAGFAIGSDGSVVLDPAVAAACFYNDCDPAVAAGAVQRLGPHPLRALQQSPAEVAWRTTPSTYVVCTDDLAVHPDLQRLLAERCGSAVEWATGHSPFLSQPDRVVTLVEELARLGPDGEGQDEASPRHPVT